MRRAGRELHHTEGGNGPGSRSYTPIIRMPPAPVNRTLLIAGIAAAVVACAAVVYFVSRPSESGASEEEEGEEEEEEEGGAGAKAGTSLGSAAGGSVTKAKLMAVLKDMSSNLQTFEAELMEQKVQLVKSGLPEERVIEILETSKSKRMTEINAALEKKHELTQQDISIAMDKFKGDAEVQALLDEFQRVVFGDEAAEQMKRMESLVPADLTIDTFLPLLRKHSEITSQRMEAMFAKATAETKSATMEEKHGYLMLLLSKEQGQLQAELAAATGMTEEVFVGCLHKFGQGDQRCMMILMEMQQRLEEIRGAYLGVQ